MNYEEFKKYARRYWARLAVIVHHTHIKLTHSTSKI